MTEKDIVKRMKIIHNRFEKVKRSALPILLGGTLGELINSMPTCVINRIMKISTQAQNISLTNFPGPTREMDLFGYPLKRLYANAGFVVGTNGKKYSLKNVFSVSLNFHLL
jgi:hypothetical protein